MRLLEIWVRTPAAAALGKTLIHSVWEGAVVALALSIALCCIRSSRGRYAAACVAMLSMLGMLGITYLRQQPPRPMQGSSLSAAAGSLRVAGGSEHLPAAASGLPGTASRYVPWLAPLWIAGVLSFHLWRAALTSTPRR